MFLMAFVAGEFGGHVRLVELFALVAGQAVSIHRGACERSFLDQLGWCQPVFERIECLGVPRIHMPCALVTSGATAGIATRLLRVDVRESRTRVNAGDRARIGEFIPQIATDAYEQDEKTGDDGEPDDTLADGSKGPARLAFGDCIAASSVRKRAVLALATAGSRARASPVSFCFSRFYF